VFSSQDDAGWERIERPSWAPLRKGRQDAGHGSALLSRPGANFVWEEESLTALLPGSLTASFNTLLDFLDGHTEQSLRQFGALSPQPDGGDHSLPHAPAAQTPSVLSAAAQKTLLWIGNDLVGLAVTFAVLLCVCVRARVCVCICVCSH